MPDPDEAPRETPEPATGPEPSPVEVQPEGDLPKGPPLVGEEVPHWPDPRLSIDFF